MCEISDDIKLCTCTPAANFSNRKSWWEIRRRKQGYLVIGEVVIREKHLSLEKGQLEKLVHKLNHTNLFDFDYKPEPDDQLTITLWHQDKSAEYTFLFTDQGWKLNADLFNLNKLGMDPFVTEHYGIIENPFTQTKNQE